MGYSTDEKRAILKICSLFMIVDGTCHESEQALLNKVYKEMNVNDSVKKEVLDYCVSIAAAMERGDNSAQVISEIDKILDNLTDFNLKKVSPEKNRFMPFYMRGDPTAQANLLWTLINLGYADKAYTSAERKVVWHLAKIWNINKDLVTEFEDTADTILLLTNQQAWLKNESGWGYNQINERLKEIDKQIELMSKNLQTSISEIDVMGGK